ncbi:MAG: 3'-5' exonuclease [Muribaculaceae bacterium]|nr:3'-5' exonuclease [Muribaculaceae bacterium]
MPLDNLRASSDCPHLNGNFVAIDFETANGRRCSVCSVGLIIVRDGEIVDRFYSLIKPTPNYYSYWTTEIHGLTQADTESAPTFPEVWAQVQERIKGLPLVAHNKPFDESCLKAAFAEYGMEYPDYEFYCTLAASRRHLDLPSHQLHIVAEACGFHLENHHDALADAEACAAIALKILK